VPITSLDGGLVFERETNMFGRDYTQTLEPRAFYVYIPYRRQDQIPAFDTAIDDFNFSQLFTENRYLGSDRIGDANQITLAVTSRLLDPGSGDERARFAIGQRYYFQSQRVTLNEAPRSANTSDLLLSGEEGCPTPGRRRPRCSTASIIRRPSCSTSVCAGSRRPAGCSMPAIATTGRTSTRPAPSRS
jgi:lipopolysaccharide assembly outer membrane protein LptD (OstA)